MRITRSLGETGERIFAINHFIRHLIAVRRENEFAAMAKAVVCCFI